MPAPLLAQALAAHRRGALAEAQRLYREILAAAPEQPDAVHLLGVVAYQQGRLAEALALLDRAVALAPALAAAHSNRAAVLRDLGRPAEALASLDQALALQPDEAGAWCNRAAALIDLARPAEALADAERALALVPRDAAAHNNRGNALFGLGRPAEALASYEAALALDAAPAASHFNRGKALAALGRFEAAAAAFDAALQREPGHVHALVQRGDALLDAGRGDAALHSFEQALQRAPALPGLFGHWLHARLKLCDWDGLDEAFATLRRGIDAGEPLAAPFVALLAPLTRAQQQRCARTFARAQAPVAAPRPPVALSTADGRLRLAFFSADFREHPTAQLAAGLFEQLPRQRFELSAFAFGPPREDAMRARLRRAFDHFIDVAALPDEAVVALARQRGIHLAVDLGGHTRDARPGLFARRVAPLQLSWLGYPGTLGAPWIDALIADPTVVPPAHDADYDEVLVRLPHCYQANDDRREIAALDVDRAALGLPAQGFVFCCFNHAAKIGPAVFAVWMRLLAARPGSVLWLSQPDAGALPNLRRQAQRHGVDPARLVFAARVPGPLHLARQRAADLFLDTFDYNAHTTASDALWAGLPVLTCAGETFAARVAASLLRAVGLPELITTTRADYEALALELSAPGSRLPALRARLAAQRDHAPLFDTARFARQFAAACSALWQRQRDGLPLGPLQVLDDPLGDLRVVEDAPVTQAAGRQQPGVAE